jgi:hypothetical protein
MPRRKTMCGKKMVAIVVSTVVMLGTAWYAIAQDAKTPYPSMAPLDQYLMEDRNSEIALARSAAPESISRDAEVMVWDVTVTKPRLKGRTVSCAWSSRSSRVPGVCEIVGNR